MNVIPEELETEPENEQEVRELKLRNRARRNQRQTLLNLVYATLASLGVVLFMYFIVLRPSGSIIPPVDYKQVAETEQAGFSEGTLLVPEVPADWTANQARLTVNPPDGVSTWQIGFFTPEETFLSFKQAFGADAVWEARQLPNNFPTGASNIGGIDWIVYDRTGQEETGNYPYVLTAEFDDYRLLIYGTAPVAQLEQLAADIAR